MEFSPKATDGISGKRKTARQRGSKFPNGVLRRKVFAEVPPHVEYGISDFGCKFVEMLDAIKSLELEIDETNSLCSDCPQEINRRSANKAR